MPDVHRVDRTLVDRQAVLAAYRSSAGEVFGSQLVAQFLYTLVRMHRPAGIVELGRGFGVSALHLAVAAEENGLGRVWTVDDELSLEERIDVPAVVRTLAGDGLVSSTDLTVSQVVTQLADRLGVGHRLVQLNQRLDLTTRCLLPPLPLGDTRIGLLFSDFHHSPEALVRVLGWALPRLERSSSIIFDSASTLWQSWLFLEKLVPMLSAGRVPALFRELGYELEDAVAGRRFTLVPLTVPGRDLQSGPAWIRIEPDDVVPWPRATMRSPHGDMLGW